MWFVATRKRFVVPQWSTSWQNAATYAANTLRGSSSMVVDPGAPGPASVASMCTLCKTWAACRLL